MPDTTAELGLNLAKDTDDAADYEVVYLRASLTTVDGLFNQVSGHTHSGAHQGGPITGNAFAAALDIPDWFRSTGHRSAFATAGAGAELYWDGTNSVVNSYDRAASQPRPLMLRGTPVYIGQPSHDISIDGSGNVTMPNGAFHATGTAQVDGNTTLAATQINSSLTVTGGINANGGLTLGATLNANGQTVTNIGALGTSSLSVTAGATVQTLQCNGNATVSGSITTNGITCSTINTQNNTITSGAINASGAIASASSVSVLGNINNVVPYTVGGASEHIEHGHPSCNGVANNAAGTYAQTFARAFNSNPIVLLTIDTPTSGDIKDWHVAAQNVSTVGFNIRVYNTSGNGGNITVDWFAIGN